jgi:hypothetical protein
VRGADDSPGQHRQLLGAGLLLLTFSLGFLVARQGWHQLLIDGVTRFIRQPVAAVTALLQPPDAPTLTVDLAFRDYDRLLDIRDQALRLGVNVATEEGAVPATIQHADSTVEVSLRLPPGPAQPLAGETWPLEVVVQGDDALFDLRRFLLRPAAEDALRTMGYLEALRQAGHVVPRTHVVRLSLNGSDKGRYILLEQPAAEMLAAQDRQDSALVTFDPGAYWAAAARLGQALPGSGFQYARVTLIPPVDAVDSPLSPESSAARREASDLLQALSDGAVQPADALDVERTASLLAMTALWHGAPELDWRGLTFIYNPTSGRLEPVAPIGPPAPVAPVPDLLMSDPRLQVALVRAIKALSQPDVLSELQTDLAPQIAQFQGALGTAEAPWPSLSGHQTVMRHQIAPSPILFATRYPGRPGLILRLDNVQPFPVEIVGLDVGENLFLPVDPAWVVEPAKAPLVDSVEGVVLNAAVGSIARTVYLQVPPAALSTGTPPVGEVQVVARLFGLEAQHVVAATTHPEPAADVP